MTQGTLPEAYAFCRMVAKREAKNFYYAFRVLPQPKSDAMCAVYAFMRRADDIADDETQSLDQRRAVMAAWLSRWQAGGQDSPATEDLVFQALADTQRRYKISDQLLQNLVRGTTMDLQPGHAEVLQAPPGQSVDLGSGLQGYPTFAGLYQYCYLVASVVGLVCIRIFGYTDPAAELLAEQTGIAFQLTNILRDVKEDAERGRIYIPQDMLHQFGVTNLDLLALAAGRAIRPNERAMLQALSAQAWKYYEAARKLLPLIHPDSRAALWVLVEIYSSLLRQIDQRQGDVFSKRISLSRGKKIFTLVRGVALSLRARRA